MQAISDVAVMADVMVADLTAACRRIAQDLAAPRADQDAAEAKFEKKERLTAWCAMAAKQIDSFNGSESTIMVHATPPVCELSVAAMASCQARCSANDACDIDANPPTCEGGQLMVACHGECTARAADTLSCSGHCTGACDGVCETEDGVECSGRCEGVCEASGDTPGIQVDGTCLGTCKGTCLATALGASCGGRCEGQCGGTCKGTGEASVKCDGECNGEHEFLACIGGKLASGCHGTPVCDESCEASVQAKSSCRPSPVKILSSVSGDAKLSELKATLEANLGVVMVVEARSEMLSDTVEVLLDEVQTRDIKVACLPPIFQASAATSEDISACEQAAAVLMSRVGY